jgi:hypothetical protein
MVNQNNLFALAVVSVHTNQRQQLTKKYTSYEK